jgi:hypothetical protein
MTKFKKLLAIFFFLIFILAVLFFLRRTNQHHLLKGNADLEILSNYLASHPKDTFYVPKFVYIAHAGGGLGRRTYLNNLEAIENSMRRHVNFIEIDFHYSKDSVVIACHNFEQRTVAEFLQDTTLGTQLTLASLMEWLADKEVMLITDIKTNNIKILKQISIKYKPILRKIIPQAYTIPEIIEIKEMGFKNVIYTNYISRYPNSVITQLANAHCVYAITLPYDMNFKRLKYFHGFNNIPTPIFTNTVNDRDLTDDLVNSGCRGVYTDLLLLPSIK